MRMLAVVALAVLLAGCNKGAAEAPWVEWAPKQCEERAWGNATMTSPEIAQQVYAWAELTLIGEIQVFIADPVDPITCQACNVCPDGRIVYIMATPEQLERLKTAGWVASGGPPTVPAGG